MLELENSPSENRLGRADRVRKEGIAQPFATLAEVRAYLSEPKIECLLCGRQFERIQYRHLKWHGITSADYREQFGIPWTYALASERSREVSRQNCDHLKPVYGPGAVRGAKRRTRFAAVANFWAEKSKLGPDANARIRVVVPCSGGCGAQLETTKLTSVQPIFCNGCASPFALRARKHYPKTEKAKKARERDLKTSSPVIEMPFKRVKPTSGEPDELGLKAA